MSASEEEFVSEDEDEVGPALIKRLREKLKKTVEEKQEYLDGWQRSRADFANYKREEASMRADMYARRTADFVESLLPALDALELSLKHEESKTLRMIERQFLDALKREGVEQFGKAGDTFDPYRYEALKGDGELVTSVERSGYTIGEKIIRPAQVIL